MTKEQLLENKAKEYENSLTQWALDINLLEPGERIVYSARIESVPIVVKDSTGVFRGLDSITAQEIYDTLIKMREQRDVCITKTKLAGRLNVEPLLFMRAMRTNQDWTSAWWRGKKGRPLISQE